MADQNGNPGPVPAPPALVGRERERALLRAHLSAACAGHGTLVLISGEAGIGKTALVEDLLAEAASQDALVLVGRCYDLSETPPYGPWIEALAHAPVGDGLPGLPRAVLPAHRSDGAVVTRQEDVSRHLSTYLTALAGSRPLVLFLDDLHWADPASLDLLRVLARNLAGLSILLLATYRDDEPAVGHPVAVVLPALVREARAERLTLPRLGGDATRMLARARYRLLAGDEERLVGYLHARAEGNPLYLGELLRSLEEEGVLRPDPEMEGWAFGDPAGARVPPLLRQLIGARAARLGVGPGRLLEIAAVIGQAVPLSLWAAAGGSDEEVLSDTVEQAVAARLLVETSDGAGVRFAHALIREALYEAIPLPRRRALHRRAAAALLATPDPDPDAVANHLQRAGDPRAAGWLVEAGHRALRAFANRTAAARYEAALALLNRETDNLGSRGWCLLYLSRARFFDDPHGGIERLRDVLHLATMAGDRALAAYARYDLGFHLTGIGGQREGLPEMAAGVAAIKALTPEECLQARGPGDGMVGDFGTFALRLAHMGYYEQALAVGRQASEEASEGEGVFAQAEAHAALGHVDEALALRDRGYAALKRRGSWSGVGIYMWFGLQRLNIPYQADQLEKRRQLAEEATAGFARSEILQGGVTPRLGRLPLLVLEGKWAEARALGLAVEAGSRTYRPGAVSMLAEVAFAQGDRTLLAALVRKTLPDGTADEPGCVFILTGLRLQRLAALQAIAEGDLATARAWLEARDRWLAWCGAVQGQSEGQLAWAIYYRAAGNPTEARAHAEAALDRATTPRQPLALLAAQRLLGELDTAAGCYDGAVAHLDVALALADACAAPYERALTLLALAEQCLAIGDRRGAGRTLEEARALLVPLEARPALVRADALAARLVAEAAIPPDADHPASPTVGYPARLTAREVEVLRLVVAGRSNREMAIDLCRSERTIERHLENIYRKIDARNRAETVAYALRHHLA